MERLQKIIAQSGVASRRKAEELILEGKVKVNDVVVTTLGTKVSDKDYIEVDNKPISKETKEYYLLNKPRGVISATVDDKNRKTVVDLIPTNARIYPIGRLDYDTTGLILLTNDGDFSNILMHPSNQINKVYVAKLKGIIKKEQIVALETGVIIDEDILVKSSKVKLKKVNLKNNTSLVQITINEGRNHQVKKMFEQVGFEVLKLKREKVAFFDLKNLNSGEYRKLTPKEVAQVFSLQNSSKNN